MAHVKKSMNKLFGALILVIAVSALAPTIFENLAALAGAESDTPAWVVTLITLISGVALVYIIWGTVE